MNLPEPEERGGRPLKISGFLRNLIIVATGVILILGGFFYFRNQVYFSQGSFSGRKMFVVEKGQGVKEVAEKLKKEGLISEKIYFYYYIRSQNLVGKIMPGQFQLSGDMTIGEIVQVLTNPEEKFVRITFPEGWRSEQMAERLNENGLSGNDFLRLVKNPANLKKRYSYLSVDGAETLEGYLFPDTYFFKKDISAENIIGRMLDNFDSKLDDTLREKISQDKKSIREEVIMASILEREAQKSDDMKIVAGIFWKRLENGQRLQSDATLSYYLNDKKDQHSGADLEVDTPYNSYMYAGLPPSPIGNPGIKALNAAVYPQQSDYFYFLTAGVNGESQVVYSKTYDEHLANKAKYGL